MQKWEYRLFELVTDPRDCKWIDNRLIRDLPRKAGQELFLSDQFLMKQ